MNQAKLTIYAINYLVWIKIKISTFTHFYLLINSPFISPFFISIIFKVVSLIKFLELVDRSKIIIFN